MKIGITGKGGVGKTTISGILARALAQQGHRVIALDCDSNPNLGLALGLTPEETDRLAGIRQALDAGEGEHAPTVPEMLERFGAEAPDGVRLAVVTRIEEPNPGCPCCGISPEKLLGQLEAEGRVVIADFEAGLGTLSRMQPDQVDMLLVVVEPTAKSLEVGRRALELIRERGVGDVRVIANRVRGEDDARLLEGSFEQGVLTSIPEDPAVRAAGVQGVSPFDAAPDAPAVRAVSALAESLTQPSHSM
ncbi:carbon monoxide dehydrogenase accessory protein CooC [soil metagenome]